MPLYIPGTATAADVRAGKKFSAGVLYSANGGVIDYSGQTISSTAAFPSDGVLGLRSGSGIAGIFDGATLFQHFEPNFLASNIRNGVSLFGKTGNLVAGGYTELTLTSSSSPANYTQHNGSATTSTYLSVDTSALSFTPKFIVALFSTDSSYSGGTTWSNVDLFSSTPNGSYANCIYYYDPTGTASTKLTLMRVPYAIASNFKFPVGRANQSYTLKIYG